MTRDNFKELYGIKSTIHGSSTLARFNDLKTYPVDLDMFLFKPYVEYFNSYYKTVRILINNLGAKNENILNSRSNGKMALIFCDIDPTAKWKKSFISFEDFYDMQDSGDEGLVNSLEKS